LRPSLNLLFNVRLMEVFLSILPLSCFMPKVFAFSSDRLAKSVVSHFFQGECFVLLSAFAPFRPFDLFQWHHSLFFNLVPAFTPTSFSFSPFFSFLGSPGLKLLSSTSRQCYALCPQDFPFINHGRGTCFISTPLQRKPITCLLSNITVVSAQRLIAGPYHSCSASFWSFESFVIAIPSQIFGQFPLLFIVCPIFPSTCSFSFPILLFF